MTGEASALHESSSMTDFLTLVRRDHHDLECALDELLHAVTVTQLRSALDGVRLGLIAHAEAEDIVLAAALQAAPHRAQLDRLATEARVAHRQQEAALSALVRTTPATPRWRELVHTLSDLVHTHAGYEETEVIPRFQELAPAQYAALAGQFATERLRQLAMLQPSAPILVPELVAHAS
jgi:hypothetical protein